MLPKSGGHVNQQRVGALVKPKSITLRMSQRIGQAPGAGPERDPTKRAGWAQHAPGESWAAARYDKPGGPFDPHTGTQCVYSQIADVSYKRHPRGRRGGSWPVHPGLLGSGTHRGGLRRRFPRADVPLERWTVPLRFLRA
jgi:hypothetical protein